MKELIVPTENSIKTRQGLILQGLVSRALTQAGISYRENWQYDPDSEKPDFTIPDSDSPKVLIEVHQTDARNSFQMKILRAFTAVVEGKARFGNNLVSINVLFGDPGEELPKSNVDCLSSFFDVNIILSSISIISTSAASAEADALIEASRDNCEILVTINLISKKHHEFIRLLSIILKKSIALHARKELFDLWNSERSRMTNLGSAPPAGSSSFVKRGMLSGLFVSDGLWDQLIAGQTSFVKNQEIESLMSLGLLIESKSINEKNIRFQVSGDLSQYISTTGAGKLRKIVSEALLKTPDLGPFFMDIQNVDRRNAMANCLISIVGSGQIVIEKALRECHFDNNFGKIHHSRNWVADLLPIITNDSHNTYNKLMFRSKKYTSGLGNPYNNITIKSPRLGKQRSDLDMYFKVAAEVAFNQLKAKKIDHLKLNVSKIAFGLLLFRKNAAIKLQKLNPLYVVLISISEKLGLRCNYAGVQSLLSDFSDPSDPVGKYDLFSLTNNTGDKSLLVNLVAAHDKHGDDKSKEWGGRRRSMLYRSLSNKLTSNHIHGLFVLDGQWDDKDVKRLYNSGWDDIIRIDKLQTFLKTYFNV